MQCAVLRPEEGRGLSRRLWAGCGKEEDEGHHVARDADHGPDQESLEEYQFVCSVEHAFF